MAVGSHYDSSRHDIRAISCCNCCDCRIGCGPPVKPSLNWRWHKNSPGKGPTMLLMNDQGFQIMVQQIRAAKKGPASIITVNMSVPRKKQKKQVSALVRVFFTSNDFVQLIIIAFSLGRLFQMMNLSRRHRIAMMRTKFHSPG